MDHSHSQDCRCPLSSIHCPRQTVTRENWFEAIKQARLDVLEYYMTHATTKGANDAHEACDFLTVRDEETRTPLHAAAFWRRRGVLVMLLDFLAKHGHARKKEILDMQDTKASLSALMYACKIGDIPMVKALREAGSSLRIKDLVGKDAKAYAKDSENKELIDYLEENLEKTDCVETPPAAQSATKDPVGNLEKNAATAALDSNQNQDPVVDLWETDEESEADPSEEAMSPGNEERLADQDVEERETKQSREELTKTYDLLSKHNVFKVMDAKVLAGMAKRFRVRTFQKDSTIVKKHEGTPSMWMVREGEVTVIGGDGDFDLVLEDNDAYGEMPMLLDEQQACEMLATKDSVLLQLTQSAMQEVLRKGGGDSASTLAAALAAEGSGEVGEELQRAQKIERKIRKNLGIKRPKQEMKDKRQRHIEEVPLLTNERDFAGISLVNQYWRSGDSSHREALLNLPDTDGSGLPAYLKACKDLNLQPHYRAVLQLRHKTLDMVGAGMTTHDALALGAALCENKTVDKVDLSHNALHDHGCISAKQGHKGVVEAVALKSDLKELRMSCTQVSRRTAALLGQMLLQHASLTVLDLSHNLLGDKGAQAIAAGVGDSKWCSLTELNLSNNRIGNAGAAAIGKMLESSSGLQELSVSWNHICPEGCAALIDGAAHHRNLHSLSLDWNRLGHIGGEALGRFLSESNNIRNLDVSNCCIDETAADAIRDGITANTTLKVVKMHWNPLGQGVPKLLAAFRGCAAQPTFRLDNCKFDMLSHQAYTVDKANPTGHYTFNLSIEQHRQQLKVLVELGMKESGENWRNEKLDDVRFSFPSDSAWTIPDSGMLDFDFVHLDVVDEEEEETLSQDDFKSLTKQINKALSSSVRIDLIKQVLDGEQTFSILFSLAREVERLEGLVALFSRTIDMEDAMPKILLSCFERASVEALQRRLGPYHVFDPVNMTGNYSFDMTKRSDRRALRVLCQRKREFVYCSFSRAHFTPHATPYAKEDVHDVEAWTTDEEGQVPWDGALTVDFFVDKKAAADAIALARSKSKQMLLSPSKRRISGVAKLAPYLKLNKTGTQASIMQTKDEEEDFSFDFAAAMSRTRTEYKILTVRYSEGVSGVVRATGQDDKPFNARWDGGRTTMLLPLEDKKQRTLVQVLTPRGQSEIAREVVTWSSPKKTTITLQEEAAEEGSELLKAHHARSQSSQGLNPQSALDKDALHHEKSSAATFTELSIDFDLAQRRARGQRFWKPWAGFARASAKDFAVQTIRLRHRKAAIGTMMERVKAQLGEASCVNYQIDLTPPVKMHTIPRHFSIIVSPGVDIEVYANTQGLPCEENHIWKAEFDGQDRIILVRPTDKNYVAAKYFITVVTSQFPAQFEVTVQVAPYPASLRQAHPILENNTSSNSTFAAMNKRKGLTPPEAIQHLTVANSKTGRMLSSLMYYTAERRRKSSHGASVPPKATLHLRPSSAAGFDRDEFSLTGTRPSTSPERSRSTTLDEDDEEDEACDADDTVSPVLSPVSRGVVKRGSVSTPSLASPNRRRSTVTSATASKPKTSPGRLPSATSASSLRRGASGDLGAI